MRFTKVESVGNDYVLLDAVQEPALARLDDLSHRAQILSHRRTGVGADGLLILERDDDDTLAMRVINADGSEGGVCGNGLRCAVKVALERHHASLDDQGMIRVRVAGRTRVAMPTIIDDGLIFAVRVDMGPPAFDDASIPFDPAHAERLGDAHYRVAGEEIHLASMGNPHAVLFDEDAEARLESVGPSLAEHRAFPDRANIHAASVRARDVLRVVSYERGAGRTLACGSGACAVVAIGVRTGVLSPRVSVEMPGGSISCGWSGDPEDGVWMEGPARVAFEGAWVSEP